MTWLKLEGKAAFHVKTIRAGNEAYGAWTRGAEYSAEHGTDGFVSRETAILIGPERLWKRLSDVGLAHPVDGGWQIHDFLDYNPSAQEIRASRLAKIEAGRVGGHKSGRSRREAGASSLLQPDTEAPASRLVEPRSDPIRSDPIPDPPKPPTVGQLVEPTPAPDPLVAPASEPPKSRTRAKRTLAPEPGAFGTVFAAYLDGWHRVVGQGASPKPDDKRRKVVAARLADGFTVDELVAAVSGIWRSEWHIEKPSTRIEFETVLRDAKHIERAAAFGVEHSRDRPNFPTGTPPELTADPALAAVRLSAIPQTLAGVLAIGRPIAEPPMGQESALVAPDVPVDVRGQEAAS